jgi:hypothetical protein
LIFSVHYTASLPLTICQQDLFRLATGNPHCRPGHILPRPHPIPAALLQFAGSRMQALQQFTATTRKLQRGVLPVVLTHLDKLVVAQRENVRITLFQMPPGVPEQHERREFVMAEHPAPPLINAWAMSTS